MDPYFGDNEEKVIQVFEKNYIFTREFQLEESVLESDRVLLHCDGLDTIADIIINDEPVASVNNMHRTYIFNIKRYLKTGENKISILFHSAIQYLKDHPTAAGKTFASIRKASCMFGWDWGLNLPDSGIWRDIYIETFQDAKLEQVKVNQKHTDGKVELEVTVSCEAWNLESVEVEVRVVSPSKELVFSETKKITGEKLCFRTSIENPAIWWPVGYGEQPLYEVETVLRKNCQHLDVDSKKIGLRTIH